LISGNDYHFIKAETINMEGNSKLFIMTSPKYFEVLAEENCLILRTNTKKHEAQNYEKTFLHNDLIPNEYEFAFKSKLTGTMTVFDEHRETEVIVQIPYLLQLDTKKTVLVGETNFFSFKEKLLGTPLKRKIDFISNENV
jgi:hypothetical protein